MRFNIPWKVKEEEGREGGKEQSLPTDTAAAGAENIYTHMVSVQKRKAFN